MFQKIKSFLTENKNLSQTIIKNTFWMGFGQLISRLIRAILIIYAARVLGAAGYGVFSYALSLAGFFTIFSDIGLTALLTRESAKNPEQRQEYIATALVIKLGLIIVSSALILFAIPLINKIPEAAVLFPIIAVLFIFDTLRDFSFAITRSLEKMEIEAGVNISMNLIILIFGAAVLATEPSAKLLTTAYAIGAGFGFFLIFWKIRRYFSRFWIFFNKKLIKQILTEAWPFGVAMLLNAVMLNTDTIMLGWLKTPEDVGWYSAAQRIILLLYLLPGFLAVSVFPTFSRTAAADPEKFRAIFEKSLRGVLIAALPIVVGGLMTAPEIIGLIFGKEYEPAVLPFQIIILTVLFVFPGSIIGNGIFAYNWQNRLFGVFAAAAFGNALLNFLFIPVYGIVGAAAATVITQFISNGYALIIMKKINNFNFFSKPRKVFIALLFMIGAVAGLKMLAVNIITIIVTAGLIYLAVLYFLREPLLSNLKSKFI